MKYYIKRIMEGSFPGSPDVDYVRVDAEEYQRLNSMFRGRWKDTKEQADEDVI